MVQLPSGMIERVRQFDWASSPLGPQSAWSGSLKTAVDICLNSRFPMVIWWGRELVLIFNDAWCPIAGSKHKDALGQPGRLIFPEIWDIIGPMHHRVMDTGQATWSDDQLLLMNRTDSAQVEEGYFTWSYSAVPDDSGEIGGVFTAVNETTEKVLGERRLETLRLLSARASEARTVADACLWGGEALARNSSDVAFALLYLVDSGGHTARLMQSIRVERGAPVAREMVNLENACQCPWPIRKVIESGSAELVTDLAARFGTLSGGRWPHSPTDALVLPLAVAGQTQTAGVAVIGISPYLQLSDRYRSFLDLAAGHLATGISNANAYEQERRRSETLAELDRAKTAFFGNVSHEFRTPLSLMLGPLEELLRTDEDTVTTPRSELEVIHRNGLRLLRLVNNLLDFSRIEAGRSQAVYEATNLAALTTDIASVFRSATERVGLELIVDCDPLLPPVNVDRDMWEKIVLNLMSNAFKFTLEGSITVRLRERDAHAELSIEDTGTGIGKADLPHIFERFHRVPNSRARSFEGSGIGLALVHELVRLHGGCAHVLSEEGVGTTFTVLVPLGDAHLAGQPGGSAGSEEAIAVRADAYAEEALRWLPEEDTHAVETDRETDGCILIADDNADMREYLRRLLRERYNVTTACNGAEVLELLRNGPLPDLILTDVMMPVMDGFEMVARVRQDEHTRTLPVIMLSARAGEEARIEGLQGGADDYLVKPFTARELLARVDSQIALARLRRASESAVNAAEEHLRLAVEAAGLGTWERDLTTGEMIWSARGREMFAIAPDIPLDRDLVLSRIHPEDRARIASALEGLGHRDAAREFEWEHRVVLPDGTTRSIVANGKLLAQSGQRGTGPPTRIVGTVRDVTGIKSAEESMRETQKLESLGVLAGGIAHDFNNLLTGVLGNASLLTQQLAAGSPEADILASIVSAAERISRLTAQMLAYSGRGRFIIEKTDLSKQVVQITSLIRSSVPKNVHLRLALANDLPSIEADTGQLQQVIMNLVINAAEAVSPGAGAVEVETGLARVGTEELRLNVTRQTQSPGKYVVLTVRDNGCGMDQATRAKIFDPFFTTKFTGRGLGLSAVLGIIRAHAGLMTIESQPGTGTTFRVYFPVADTREKGAEPMGDQTVRGKGTVLVVDDEELVRGMARAALTKLGYSVLTAENGVEALQVYGATPDAIDVVLLDLTMPVMGGEETLARMEELRPDVVVVVTSGFDEGEAGARFGNRIAGFVQKPFTLNHLSAKIGAAFEAKR